MNETIEFAILNDGYKPTLEEVKSMTKELWDLKHDANVSGEKHGK